MTMQDIEFDASSDWEAALPSSTGEDEKLELELDGWEGPLDLLLTLARNQKVDLKQISILGLVEQYLAYIDRARSLKLEVAADYLVMAAWLALLKSALLLPRDQEADPSPEELAIRLQLRLQRLQAMRDAGARLVARDQLGRDVFTRAAPEGLRTLKTRAWDASLFDLLQAYGQVNARTAPVVHMVARRDVMTLEGALSRLEAMLGIMLEWTDIFALLPQGSDDFRRSALASSFVAALELARTGRLDLQQDVSFAPLYVKATT
jgi:segregation and condensation protein A